MCSQSGTGDICSSQVVSSGLHYYVYQFWYDSCDPRTKNFPLIGSGPWPTIFVVLLYLLFVLCVGPKIMKNREPFQLRAPMFVYNTATVVINLYFMYESYQWLEGGRQLYDFKWPDGEDWSERTMAHIWSFYLYWLIKFLDMADTIFFVLRKKYSQITFLHLYHHTVVVVLGWLFIWNRWGAPSISLFAFLNSIEHVVMYSYYALSGLGPGVQKYLWWKPYITQIQIIQFALLCIYGTFVFILQEGYPPLAYWLATGIFSLLLYFVLAIWLWFFQHNLRSS